jgi:hypothetical protein
MHAPKLAHEQNGVCTMSKGMFTLLKAKQIPIRLGNPPKKLTTGDKIKPLSFQKVGPMSEQPEVV